MPFASVSVTVSVGSKVESSTGVTVRIADATPAASVSVNVGPLPVIVPFVAVTV